MVFEILIAILAICGVLMLVWCITGLFLRPIGGARLRLLYAAEGNAEALEQTARGIAWLRETGLLAAELAVVDCGLSEEGLALVRALCARMDFIRYLPEPSLGQILKTER